MYLLAYRSSVHATTGVTPEEIYTGTYLRLPLDLIRGCPPEEKDCPNYGSYVQNPKPTSIKFTNQYKRTFSTSPNMRKQPMTEHPDMPTFMNNRKFGCIILAASEKGLRSSKAIGKDLIRLSRRLMMFSASRRYQKTKRRSFILIDWQPITIGNFFCSPHGYFEPWFFP